LDINEEPQDTTRQTLAFHDKLFQCRILIYIFYSFTIKLKFQTVHLQKCAMFYFSSLKNANNINDPCLKNNTEM